MLRRLLPTALLTLATLSSAGADNFGELWRARGGATLLTITDRGDSACPTIDLAAAATAETGNTTISADNMTYDGDTLTASGDVLISHHSSTRRLALHGDRASTNAAGTISADNIAVYDATIGAAATADNIHATSNSLVLERARYTLCNPDSPTWSIAATRLRYSADDQRVYIYQPTAYWHTIPVMWLPYLSYPSSTRGSGLLSPTWRIYSRGDKRNVVTLLPYYFDIAPNHDMTLTWRSASRGPQAVIGEYRGMSEHTSTDITALVSEDEHWRATINERITTAPVQLTVAIDRASDELFAEAFPSDDLPASTPYLYSRFAIATTIAGHNVSISGNDVQQLSGGNGDYFRTPLAITIGHTAITNGQWQWQYHGGISQFDRPDDLNSATRVGTRAYANVDGDYYGSAAGWRLNPRLKLYLRRYDSAPNNAPDDSDQAAFIIPSLQLHADTTLTRRLGGYTLALQPQLALIATPYYRQDELPLLDSTLHNDGFDLLFADNRYSGIDRIGDDQRAAVGINAMVIDPNGEQQLQWRIGRAFFAEAPTMGDNGFSTRSDIFTDATMRFGDMTVTAAARIDPENTGWRAPLASSIAVGRQHDGRSLRLEYAERSAAHPLGQDRSTHALADWRGSRVMLATSVNYSLRYNRITAMTVNTGFDGCCWRLNVFGRTILRDGVRDNGFGLTLTLPKLSSRDRGGYDAQLWTQR